MRGTFTIRYDSDGTVVEQPLGRLAMLWMDAPAPGIDRRAFTATISGSFTPDVDGDWTFGITAVGPIRVSVDGATIADLPDGLTGGAYFGNANVEQRVTVPLRAGVPCTIDIVHPEPDTVHLRAFSVGAAPPASAMAMRLAIAAAEAADVAVVVVGTNSDWETEGEDRTTIDLPGEQNDLIAHVAVVNPRTIVVINAGSPVAMPWLDDVAAVVQIWFPGEALGDAVADVLLGVEEPGGRLPMTMPKQLDDTPAFEHHPGRDGRAVYAERRLIGYRWYDAQGIEPLFPFGHGLGYTTFELGEATVSGTPETGVRVAVSVTNTGSSAGEHRRPGVRRAAALGRGRPADAHAAGLRQGGAGAGSVGPRRAAARPPGVRHVGRRHPRLGRAARRVRHHRRARRRATWSMPAPWTCRRPEGSSPARGTPVRWEMCAAGPHISHRGPG